MPRCSRVVALVVALTLAGPLAGAARAEPPADLSGLKENAAVSVREGDTWSPATFSKKEGRKYLVKYEDGTEEWVTAERLKPAKADGDATTQPAAPKPSVPVYKRGDPLEIKWGGLWEKCTVVNRRGEWVLVEYDGWTDWREWAEPWRLRKRGSTYDIDVHITNPKVTSKNQLPPPRPTPGDAPTRDGIAGRPARPGTSAAPDPFSPPSTGLPIKEAVRTGKTIAPAAEAYTFVPAASPKFTPTPIVLPPLGDFFSSYGALRLSGSAGLIPITTRGGSGNGTSGLVKLNLTAGTAQGVTMNGASRPIDLSPSGNLVAAQSNGFHHKTSSRLDVYKTSGQTTTHVVSFTPDGGGEDIHDAMFVDEKQLLVLAGDTLALWDFASATSLWQMPVAGRTIARAADGKAVAVNTDGGICLLDPASGTVLGLLDGDGADRVSFSGDGQRLLALTDSVLSVWDLKDGKPLFQIGLPPGVAGNLTAIDSDFALIGPYLFSLAKKAAVWKYDGDVSRACAAGRVFAVTGDRTDRSRTVASAVLPHPAAATAARAALAAPMVLRPGMAVSLDLQQEAPEPQRQAAAVALTRRLNKAGIQVLPNQPVRIVARTEVAKQENREYEKRIGFDRSTENVTITTKVTTLSVQAGDKVCWSVSRNFSNDPGYVVMIKQNSTVQDEVNHRAVSTNDWIGQVAIPAYVSGPVNLETLPVSRWLIGGVKDQ